MTPTFWLYFALALAGWFALSVLIGWLVGYVLRDTTGEPPPREVELLDLEDIDWDFPRRDAA